MKQLHQAEAAAAGRTGSKKRLLRRLLPPLLLLLLAGVGCWVGALGWGWGWGGSRMQPAQTGGSSSGSRAHGAPELQYELPQCKADLGRIGLHVVWQQRGEAA